MANIAQSETLYEPNKAWEYGMLFNNARSAHPPKLEAATGCSHSKAVIRTHITKYSLCMFVLWCIVKCLLMSFEHHPSISQQSTNHLPMEAFLSASMLWFDPVRHTGAEDWLRTGNTKCFEGDDSFSPASQRRSFWGQCTPFLAGDQYLNSFVYMVASCLGGVQMSGYPKTFGVAGPFVDPQKGAPVDHSKWKATWRCWVGHGWTRIQLGTPWWLQTWGPNKPQSLIRVRN
jgi:hypothetical protein